MDYIYPEFSQTGLPDTPLLRRAYAYALEVLRRNIETQEESLAAAEAHHQQHVDGLRANLLRKEEVVEQQVNFRRAAAARQNETVPENLEEDVRQRLEAEFSNARLVLDNQRRWINAARAQIQKMLNQIADRAVYLATNYPDLATEKVLAATLLAGTVNGVAGFWDVYERFGAEDADLSRVVAQVVGVNEGDLPLEKAGEGVAPVVAAWASCHLTKLLAAAERLKATPPDPQATVMIVEDGLALDENQQVYLPDATVFRFAARIQALHALSSGFAEPLVEMFGKVNTAFDTGFALFPDDAGGLMLRRAVPANLLTSVFTPAARPSQAVKEPENPAPRKDKHQRRDGGWLM